MSNTVKFNKNGDWNICYLIVMDGLGTNYKRFPRGEVSTQRLTGDTAE